LLKSDKLQFVVSRALESAAEIEVVLEAHSLSANDKLKFIGHFTEISEHGTGTGSDQRLDGFAGSHESVI
jgi:hypothetical protein